jgi:hypothetical protein
MSWAVATSDCNLENSPVNLVAKNFATHGKSTDQAVLWSLALVILARPHSGDGSADQRFHDGSQNPLPPGDRCKSGFPPQALLFVPFVAFC